MKLLSVKGLYIPVLATFLLLFLQSASALHPQTTVGGTASQVTVPKWLAIPTLDGKCADPEYAESGTVSLLTPTGQAGILVKLLHSGLDLYLCFDGMNHTANQRAVVRVEPDHSRTAKIHLGSYEFSVSETGAISTSEGSLQGDWAPLRFPPDDFAAAVSVSDSNTWSAELRISLEWLGGYARTDSLSLAVEGADGTAFQAWPGATQATSPDSWGDLVLAPLYSDSLSAGSAFLDGREGYLVVPYSPDLNPNEITIEAWVKVVGGDCGTLVGNGRNESYWLALCQVIQFGHDGRDSVLTGQIPLGDGWHHLAVTMDAAKGMQTLYFDGEVDLHAGWEPAHEESPEEKNKQPEKLGISDRLLRIGSDRDAPSELDHLHGYISELRIWNRVRTTQEIRAAAFERLSGGEPGLIALWPFSNGLQDIVGHHDAGLIANASLAREMRDVTEFPQRPAPPPYTYPGPEPTPPWDAHIPFVSGEITVDGICSLPEYPEESQLILEPDRAASMRLVVARDALYLCTNILWGGSGLESSVTLWINRNGQGGAAPGPADLRVQLMPDGSLTAATGDGSGYAGPAPQGLTKETIAMPRLASQEDVRPVNSPVWMSELRIPLETLAPFVPGQRLRFALFYKGMMAAGVRPGMPKNDIAGQWPAQFDPQQPDTWGVATTEQGVSTAGTATVANAGIMNGQAEANGMILITPEVEKTLKTERLKAKLFNGPTSWPRPAPTEDDFDDGCPGGDPAAWTYNSNKKWPKVDAGSHPTVKAEGTLTDIGISREDAPLIHDTHDLDMHMSVRQEDRWIVLDGGENLVLETESGPFDERTLPLEGDHVTVAGRWIFDCGHAPKTEIHPLPLFESDRLESLPSQDGTGSVKLVRVARIRLTSNPGGAFTYILNPVSFSMDLPPASYGGDRLPFIRVVEGPAANVALTGLSDTKAEISITPPGSTGDFYWELMLGYLDPPNPPSAAGKGYTVTLDKIEIKDDLDCCSVGEWTFFVAFNNTWQKVWELADVDTDESYDINRQFPAFAGDQPWGGHLHLRVIGYEDDWNAAGSGDDIVQGAWDLGPLAERCCGQNTWQQGPWKLYFTVSQGYDGPTALPKNDSFFWLFRLLIEPNDPTRTDLGTLPVSEGGPQVTEKNSYLTNWPFQKSGVYALAYDIDRYQFALEDLADVTIASLPSGVQLEQETFPWEYAGNLSGCPDLGYKSAWLKVFSKAQDITDQPYTLKLTTKWKTLPEDWGEQDDWKRRGLPQGGRLVDLVTPEDGTVTTEQYGTTARTRQKPCAWQHVTEDVDDYDIWIPRVQTRPKGQPVCFYDQDGKLELAAYPMHLSVPAVDVEADDSVMLTNLNAQFPNQHVYVRVKSSTGHRGIYRLWAQWVDGVYHNSFECALIGELHRLAAKLTGILSINPPVPDPGPLHLDVSQRGTYQLVRPEADGTFDTIISGFRNQPLLARLFDLNGVLLGEGTPLGEESSTLSVPDGQIPQSHLSVQGLNAKCSLGLAVSQRSRNSSQRPASCVAQFYLLQLVPLFDVGPSGKQSITVGLTRQQPEGVVPPGQSLSRYRWVQEFQQGQLVIKQELLRTLQVQLRNLGVPLQPGARGFAEVKDFRPETGFIPGLPPGLQLSLDIGSLSGLVLAKSGEKYQALFQALNAQGVAVAELLIQITITERVVPPGQPHANPGGPYTAQCTPSAATSSRDCEARVTLDGSGSLAATGHKLVRYQWDFGDTQSGEGVQVTHLYKLGPTESEHRFTACLTVTDDLNQQDKACTLVTITRPGR